MKNLKKFYAHLEINLIRRSIHFTSDVSSFDQTLTLTLLHWTIKLQTFKGQLTQRRVLFLIIQLVEQQLTPIGSRQELVIVRRSNNCDLGNRRRRHRCRWRRGSREKISARVDLVFFDVGHRRAEASHQRRIFETRLETAWNELKYRYDYIISIYRFGAVFIYLSISKYLRGW